MRSSLFYIDCCLASVVILLLWKCLKHYYHSKHNCWITAEKEIIWESGGLIVKATDKVFRRLDSLPSFTSNFHAVLLLSQEIRNCSAVLTRLCRYFQIPECLSFDISNNIKTLVFLRCSEMLFTNYDIVLRYWERVYPFKNSMAQLNRKYECMMNPFFSQNKIREKSRSWSTLWFTPKD